MPLVIGGIDLPEIELGNFISAFVIAEDAVLNVGTLLVAPLVLVEYGRILPKLSKSKGALLLLLLKEFMTKGLLPGPVGAVVVGGMIMVDALGVLKLANIAAVDCCGCDGVGALNGSD